MRIAQVTSLQESVPPVDKNGLEFVVHFLTEGLIARGHEVTLFGTGDSKTSARLHVLWPTAVSRDLFGSKMDGAYFSRWSHEAAYLRSNEFDLIHTHDVCGMFWALLQSPLVVTVHSPVERVIPPYKKHFPRRYWPYMGNLENKLRDTYLVFISESQRRHYPKGRHHFVVHNGIPVDDFTFCLNPDSYFAFLGYMNPAKGAHVAIEAARRAQVELRIAGKINTYLDREYFKEKIEPALDGRKIRFLGPLRYFEKIEFLRKARAVFVPVQWEEPFGLVMVEAMACGTPVIALNRGAVPEIVVNKKTGFVCENVEEMVEAVKKIDQIDRRVCREHVEKNFSVEKMVEGYEKVYEQVIEDFEGRF